MSSSHTRIGVKPVIPSKSSARDNGELILGYTQAGYSNVLVSITNLQYREKSKRAFQLSKNSSSLKVPSPSAQDVNIYSGPHVESTIGLIASWIELEHENDSIAEFSRQVLMHELEYAKFIGLKHLIIAPPKDLLRLSQFSNIIQDILQFTSESLITISVSLPICEELQENSIDPLGTWDMWNSIRTSVDYNDRLKLSLALAKGSIPLEVVYRWYSEPVSCLLMSSSVFLINNKGYPVLSKSNQRILEIFKSKSPLLLLHGLEKAPQTVEHSGYMQYLKYITVKNHQTLSKIDEFGMSHNDVLLPPLQPLHQNLDNFTYSVFECDTVKYDLYGKAIFSALNDLSQLTKINIAIAGAGKGGLVDCVFNIITKLEMQFKCVVTAIEKNSSAVISLEQRNIMNWGSSIQIIHTDMRSWTPKESYNIIISELLGSFGCNELSPECLKPLEQYLDREHGIFIPQEYTSHLIPVSSPKLYAKLQSLGNPDAFHKQYVCKLHEYSPCCHKANDLWTFSHPLKTDLTKRSITTFRIHAKTTIHGLAGYFSARLYKDIIISTKPDEHTQDLISWFPFYFPLEMPLYVTDDTELEVSMIRGHSGGRTWYSWSLECFMYLIVPSEDREELQVRIRTNGTKIHNHKGRAYAIEESIIS